MMKAQCVHCDVGLCKTCFDYEVKIAELTARFPLTAEGVSESYKQYRSLLDITRRYKEALEKIASPMTYGQDLTKIAREALLTPQNRINQTMEMIL